MWNIRRRVKIWASQVTEDHEDHTMKTMGHHLFIYVCVWRGGGVLVNITQEGVNEPGLENRYLAVS